MNYFQYLQKAPSLEFEDSPMIKSISYERKINFFLEENPRNRYISFIVEKNWICLMKVTLVSFIAPEVPYFMEGKNVHIWVKYLYLVMIKYL
jgi:hypothetical protein